MSDDKTQIGVEVDSALLEQFRQQVEEIHGSRYGHMRKELERALESYIEAYDGGDNIDRLKRIERKIDALDADSDENKKDSNVSNTTERRAEEIRQQIEDESDGSIKVHEEVVELAIRENAGSSQPTIRRYKELLQQDEYIFKHPTKSIFFTDSENFVKAVNAMRKGGRIGPKEYSSVLDNYGEEWWLAQQEQDKDDQPKGFQ